VRQARSCLPAIGIVCVLVCLVLTASASATRSTTQPGTTLRVYVILTDKGIRYTMFHELSTGGTTGLIPAHLGGLRGEIAVFNVWNKGKRQHSFALLGKQTGALRPGRKAEFSVALVQRGSFRYESTLDKGKKFRGTFLVR
jgi:hypothetical protein